MDWKCKMADNWVKLEYVRFPAECLDCKKMIYRGETAFWLPTTKILLHPKCGLGSKPISDLLSIYTENQPMTATHLKRLSNIHQRSMLRENGGLREIDN